MSDFKNCTKCGHSLPATAEFFSPQKRGVRGLHSQCRECIQKARRERYQNNPEYRERLLAQNKASRERRGHRTRAKASPEELERNRIRMIEYRKRPDVIERKKAYSKEYKRRPEVAERIKEYSKEYRKRPGG